MSDSERSDASLVVAGLALVAFLGRSCDDIARIFSHVDEVRPVITHIPDLPRPSIVTEIPTSTDDAIHTSPSGQGGIRDTDWRSLRALTSGSQPQMSPAAEQIAGGRIPGELLTTSRLKIYSRVWVEQPVSTPRLLVLFPENADEYQHVYNNTPTASAEAHIRSLNQRFAIAPATTRFRSHASFSQAILDNQDASPLVILGHSENEGRTLVLPSGERITVEEVHTRCLEAGANCIVLTCHSEDLGIHGEITPRDALAMWETAHEQSIISKLTVVDFALVMRRDHIYRSARKKIVISGVGIASTGGGGVYVYMSSRDQ